MFKFKDFACPVEYVYVPFVVKGGFIYILGKKIIFISVFFIINDIWKRHKADKLTQIELIALSPSQNKKKLYYFF